jgi:hypothetical protein
MVTIAEFLTIESSSNKSEDSRSFDIYSIVLNYTAIKKY